MEEKVKTKWYDNKGLVVILLIVFAPVGLFALWKNSVFKTITKTAVTAIVAVIFAIVSFQDRPDASNSKPVLPIKAERNLTAPSSSTSAKKTIEEEIAQLKAEYKKCVETRNKLNNENPDFLIQGEIKDRERNSLQVWGTARALRGDNPFGTVTEANIIILNPDQASIRGNFYLNNEGIHYLLKKSSGKNAYGVDVPIWIYGEEPLELKKAHQIMQTMWEKREEIGRRHMSEVLVEKCEIPSNDEEAIAKLKALNNSLQNFNSFKGVTVGSDRELVENLTDNTGTIDDVTLFMFPQEGVIILADNNSVLSLTYLLQADIIAEYYSFAKQFKLTSSFKAELPLDAPLISDNDYLRKLNWGGGWYYKSSLPELGNATMTSTENNPEGNGYAFICRTDRKATDILAVSVYNLDKKRFATKYLPLDFVRADNDPVLGLQAVN